MSSFQVNVNGHLYSAISATVDIAGDIIYGLRTLNFSEESPEELQFGFGQVALGTTRGNYTPTVDIEIIKHEADILIEKLETISLAKFKRKSFGGVPFDIGVALQEAPPLSLSTVQILGARIISHEVGIQTGGSAIVSKFGLRVIRPIRTNGKCLVPDPYGDSPTSALIGGIVSV